jgi:hypothetical protein
MESENREFVKKKSLEANKQHDKRNMVDWNKIEKKLRELYLKEYQKRTDAKEIADIKDYTELVIENFQIWTALWTKIGKLEKSAIEDSFSRLFVILFLIEGPLGYVVNWITHLLMVKGHHDIWSRQKLVTSFYELVEIDLYIKLEFLEKHDFGEIGELCPRGIRNAIAHMNFRIQQDGVVQIIRNRKVVGEYTQDELTEKIKAILKLFQITTKVLKAPLK